MSNRGRLCPECQSELKLVMLSDLVGELKVGGVKATVPAASAVFDYFDFWVCPQCGRTLIYADDRARAAASGKEIERGGSILGLT
ncbi:MAG TPA: hypothetical protein VJS44_18665 [Pyrinomonadaceae bacterium]|nr:hypothetical protein [Pyrinomonadaceae bacterium]